MICESQRWTILAAALLAAAGCGTIKNTAVFVTKTSFGLDVDSKPPAMSIAYDRVEGFYGPRFSSGGLPQVAGVIQTDGNFFNRKIHQVYATGRAASIVTSTGTVQPSPPKDLKGEREPMFFGTSTTTGFKVAFEEAALSEVQFGYKRREISVIPLGQPIDAGGATYSYPSVLATLDNGYTAAAKQGDNKFDVVQFFATGEAAENIAQDGGIREQFKRLGAEGVQAYREQERTQRTSALRILTCLSYLPDEKLDDVRANGATLRIFVPTERADELKKATATPRTWRSIYTGQMMNTDAHSPEYTGRLEGHEAFVCKLAGR